MGDMSDPDINATHGDSPRALKTIVVGCGLGGLACAIQLRREKLPVLILEKAAELSEVGAGLQLPPNAVKVMEHFGLLEKLFAGGLVVRERFRLLRWKDGAHIGSSPGPEWSREKFGNHAGVIHRADYQRVLVEEARRLGVEIRLGCEVVDVECEYPPTVVLASGERIQGDVVVGADGLRSAVRTAVLGYVKEPEPTGDSAYRITIPREKLENDPDPFISGIVNRKGNTIYWGPNMHVVLYTVKHGALVNLVLLCPDDLPDAVSKQAGDLEEMRSTFRGWDPRLGSLLSKVDKVLKWRIWDMEALDTWVKGSVALLGDACHPSVPYAGSGAAMAVEDGAVLARLIGLFARSDNPRSSLPQLVALYEDVRKERATDVVGLANENRKLFHMEDGPEQQERDASIAEHDWYDENRSFPWRFMRLQYSHQVFGFDVLQSVDEDWAKSDLSRGLCGE